MRGTPATPAIEWHAETPVSRTFADPYYSLADGLAESGHVFLDGNHLGSRFFGAQEFRIAELGFGTGLNFVATLALWRQRTAGDAPLVYTAFEIAPLCRARMRRALAVWPEVADETADLLAAWSGPGTIRLPGATLTVIAGDARETVPAWKGTVDAWFLDGFAPARNPEMWEAGLLNAVHARTVPGGTAATYSAAGAVRRNLAAAGFAVTRQPGYARKRDMTTARRP